MESPSYTMEMFNLFDFFGKSYVGLVGSLAGTILILFMHANLGSIFFKNLGFFQRVLFGISFSAAIVTFLVSFNANYARIAINVDVLVISVLLLWKLLKELGKLKANRKPLVQWHNFLTAGSLTFLLTVIFAFLSLLLELNRKIDGKVLINAHQAYFSGIPLEIFQAHYDGRLRILDSYPITYPRYHFFNGYLSAVLMKVFTFKSYEGFMIAKIVLIALLCAILVEIVSGTKYFKIRNAFKAIPVVTYVFTVLAVQVYWGLFTNNFTPIFFFLFLLLSVHKKHEPKVFMAYLALMSICTGRSAIPAIFIGIYFAISSFSAHFGELAFPKIVVRNGLRKMRRNVFVSIFFGTILLADVSMFLTGESIGIKSPLHLLRDPVASILPMGWMYLMSPSIAWENFLERDYSVSPVKPSIWFFLYSCTVVFFVVIKSSISKGPKIARPTSRSPSMIVVSVGLAFIVISVLGITFENKISKGISYLFAYYAFPIISSFLLFSGLLRRIIFVYIGISLCEIMFFDPSVWFANWALVEWAVLLGICLKIYEFGVNRLQGFIALVVLSLGLITQGLPINPTNLFMLTQLDGTTHLIELGAREVSLTSTNKENIYCYQNDIHALLVALKGIHSTYDIDASNRFVIAPGSHTPRLKDLKFISEFCS